MKIYLATFRYRGCRGDQSLLKMRMREIAATRVRDGYRRIHVLLSREGWHINATRVYQLYQLKGLSPSADRTSD